jgi:hypothetical protein
VIDRHAAEIRPGDVVYVFYRGQPAFEHATAYRGLRLAGAEIVKSPHADRPIEEFRANVERLAGRPRVWLVHGIPLRESGPSDPALPRFYRRNTVPEVEPRLHALFDERGRRIQTVEATGAKAVLYDLRGP